MLLNKELDPLIMNKSMLCSIQISSTSFRSSEPVSIPSI